MLLFGNATVVTFDENSKVIHNGGVIIEGSKILAVGNTQDLRIEYPKNIFG